MNVREYLYYLKILKIIAYKSLPQKCNLNIFEVYNKHGTTLLHKFESMCGDHYNEIFHTISLCTLDVVCEAALGTHVDAQNKPSPYLDAVWRFAN